MKRQIKTMMCLILVFCLMLTGCNGKKNNDVETKQTTAEQQDDTRVETEESTEDMKTNQTNIEEEIIKIDFDKLKDVEMTTEELMAKWSTHQEENLLNMEISSMMLIEGKSKDEELTISASGKLQRVNNFLYGNLLFDSDNEESAFREYYVDLTTKEEYAKEDGKWSFDNNAMEFHQYLSMWLINLGGYETDVQVKENDEYYVFVCNGEANILLLMTPITVSNDTQIIHVVSKDFSNLQVYIINGELQTTDENVKATVHYMMNTGRYGKLKEDGVKVPQEAIDSIVSVDNVERKKPTYALDLNTSDIKMLEGSDMSVAEMIKKYEAATVGKETNNALSGRAELEVNMAQKVNGVHCMMLYTMKIENQAKQINGLAHGNGSLEFAFYDLFSSDKPKLITKQSETYEFYSNNDTKDFMIDRDDKNKWENEGREWSADELLTIKIPEFASYQAEAKTYKGYPVLVINTAFDIMLDNELFAPVKTWTDVIIIFNTDFSDYTVVIDDAELGFREECTLKTLLTQDNVYVENGTIDIVLSGYSFGNVNEKDVEMPSNIEK